jgi:hypothetical protein
MEESTNPVSRLLLGLNLFSLDAPLVAVAWQWAISRETGVLLDWRYYVILGGSVWCIYTADRLIDAFRLQPAETPAPRRLFSLRHFRPLLLLCASATLAMVLLSFAWLPRTVLLSWILLGGAVAGYFLLVHGIPGSPPAIPKEFLVALLFAAGASIFPFSLSSFAWIKFQAPLLGTFLLLFGNAWLISKWERRLDRGSLQSSIALDHPRTTRLLPTYLATLVLAGLAAAACSALSFRFGVSISASAGLLLALDLATQRIGLEERRELADLVLLTPLILVQPWI